MARPLASKRWLIAPVRLRRVASGLMIDRVRSIAIVSLACLRVAEGEGRGYSGGGRQRPSGRYAFFSQPAALCCQVVSVCPAAAARRQRAAGARPGLAPGAAAGRVRAASPAGDRSRSQPSPSTGGSALLVMLGDKAVEQADAERGGALRHGRGVLFRPGDAGDVEMCPWHVVDKALQELRADRAAGG